MNEELSPLHSGWKKRVATIAVGHTAKRVEEWLFDWLLYGYVVAMCTLTWGAYHGALAAFAIMAPLSAMVCLIYIGIYNWLQADWLGLELLKDFARASSGGFFSRLAHRIVRHGQLPAFLMLSIYGDPFMTTVYLRRGAGSYGKLTPRDLNIFWASVFLSNGYWTLRWTILIELVIYVWQTILEPFLRNFQIT